MRTAVVCLLAWAAAQATLAADGEPVSPPRPPQIRIDGWDLQFLPPRPQPEAAKLAPVPEPAATLEPIPPLPHLSAPVCLEAFTYRLKHRSASAAAESLDQMLRSRHAISVANHGLVAESKVVIVPDAAGHSLVVVTTPERAAEIQQLLKQIDAPPKQFVIKARVTQLGPDGRRRVIGAPTVQTVEGQPVAIVSKGDDGQRFELELIIEEAAPSTSAPIKNVSATDETIPADPQEWIELTVPPRKDETPGPPAADGESPVEQALDADISLHFQDMRLEDFVRHVAARAGINIVLDPRGLDDAAVTPDCIVSLDADNVPLRRALDDALKPLGLVCTVRHEVLQITSPRAAAPPPVSRVYPVGDLVGETDPDKALQDLADAIRGTVEPARWIGLHETSIKPLPALRCLVVRQSAEIHGHITDYLADKRRERQSPETPTPGPAKPSERRRAAEQQIRRRLEEPISLRFDGTPLEAAMRQTAEQAGINVFLDPNGALEEGVEASAPVSLDVRDISLQSALALLLEPMCLSFMVEDEVLKVTSRERALGQWHVVTYPVADLVVEPDMLVSDSHESPEGSQRLIEMVKATVQPDSWDERGGTGSVRWFESTYSLVVRQQKPQHAQIADLLQMLRDATHARDGLTPVGKELSAAAAN